MSSGSLTPLSQSQVQTLIDAIHGGTYATTATANGNTVLTAASAYLQRFTGSLNQAAVLPAPATLPRIGFAFLIFNDSSGSVTVKTSEGDSLFVLPALSAGITIANSITDDDWTTRQISGFPTVADVNALLAARPVAPEIIATATVDLNDDSAPQTLYTVPANRKLIVTDFVFRESSANASSARGRPQIHGTDIVTDDVRLGAMGIAPNNQIVLSRAVSGDDSSRLTTNMPIAAAGHTVDFSVTAVEGHTLTCKVDIIGYLTDNSGVPVQP